MYFFDKVYFQLEQILNIKYSFLYQTLINIFSYYFILGVLGIKVKIMLPWDPNGKLGPKDPLPDYVSIAEPKEEVRPSQPTSEIKASKDIPQPAPLV